MRKLGMWRAVACCSVLGLSAMACDDDDSDYLKTYDPYPVETPEEPVPPTVESLPTNETLAIPGVSANVNVVIDRRGMPHIYAANLQDALRAQGYIMARDRFPQMEFIRRAVTGTLTEAISPVAGTATLEDDVNARFFGFKRVATQVYNDLADDDIVKTSVDAYTEGVNAWVREILAEKAKGSSANLTRFVPRGTGLFQAVIASPFFAEWEPADVMAIARYQTFVLSFDQADADRTQALQRATATFPSAPQGFAAFMDMTAFAPSREVFTTDAAGPGPVAVYPARTAPNPALTAASAPVASTDVSPAVATAAAKFGKSARRLAALVGDIERGSNNWVVSGAHTASGNPILANDPHLQLSSPAIWYYSHIVATAENIDAEGVSFAGLPSIVLGFTKNLAWGATVTNFDVVDFYGFNYPDPTDRPTIAGGVLTATTYAGDVSVAPSAVEVIRTGPASPTGDIPFPIYTVGSYGQVPFESVDDDNDPATPNVFLPQPVAVRTINFDPSNELGFFLRLLTAQSVGEAREAQATYFEAGSQNFVMIAKNGDIAWQSFSRVPQRPDVATSWAGAPSNPVGTCPTFILPSAPTHVWAGDLDPQSLPSLLNPPKGWIASANQDSIGVNRDGNPCNDSVYLGGDYDPGHREYRIAQTLASLVERGNITVADMQALQGASKSSLGETLRGPLTAFLEAAIADTDDVAQVERLQDYQDRLLAWSLETPAGVDSNDPAVIADSAATTIFNVWITRVIALAFGDEATRLQANPPAAQLLERALAVGPSNSLGMLTHDGTDTTLWDNLDTPLVTETRADILLAALDDAELALEARFGTDKDAWFWGRLHTVTFGALIPPIALDVQSIPAADDPRFANGFPRHSDWGAVDVGNYSLWNATDDTETIGLKDFAYGSGPSQRLVVEMTPEGPVAYNALPGGQSQYPDSKHHADEAALWQANQAPKLNYTPAEVAANAERKIVMTPGAAAP